MSDKKIVYSVCLLAMGKKYFLLWQDGGNEPDMFLTFSSSGDIVITNSISKLRAEAEKMKLILSDSEPVSFNVDEMMKDIARVGNAPCSTLVSNRILNGWNNLEDLAKSINVNLKSFGKAVELKNIYEKLFFGNNIPAISSEEKIYHPVFLKDERKIMRHYLRGLWSVIASKLDIIK